MNFEFIDGVITLFQSIVFTLPQTIRRFTINKHKQPHIIM